MSRRALRAIALIPFFLVGSIVGCTDGRSVVGSAPGSVVDASIEDTGSLSDAVDDGGGLDVGFDSGSMDVVSSDGGGGDGSGDATMDVVPADMGPPRCTGDGDCVGNSGGPVCDVSSGMCIGCRTSPDSCPASQHCDGASMRCVAGCRADEGCMTGDAGTGGLRCETTSHACVQCVTDTHCPMGNLCVGNLCVTGCTPERGCPGGQTCCGGACVDTQTNLAHCGRCDAPRCTADNATPSCLNGMCSVGSCTVPFGNCDSMASNGCETNTFTDVFHCGACGRACEARAHSTSTCTAGSCVYTCEAGFSDCDGNPANGCETDSANSVMNCGACGAICMPPAGVGACMMGRCVVTSCNPGRGDCNSNAMDGCETNTSTSADNCGTCANVCPSGANQAAACGGGSCGTFCLTGFQDCDSNDATGCEVNVRTDVNNCGVCNTRCTPANATPSCTAGQCGVASCNDGFANCNAMAADGCEVNLRTSPLHCGACGMACPVGSNQVATCASSVCGLACAATYVDLDRNPANGCECRSTDPDAPDDGFADTNCDGIDGNAARAIFVSLLGADGNPGTRASPKRTIQAGITAAQAGGLAVYIAEGTYNETITLASGVGLYGGYQPSDWSRRAGNTTTINGGVVAVSGSSIGIALELQRLTINAMAPSAAGTSSYGVRILNSSATVTIRSCTINAGPGAAGNGGGTGGTGSGGGVGGGGSGGSPGGGGSSSCGATGGRGGAGISGRSTGNPGVAGTLIPGGGSGGAGGGGGAPSADCCVPGDGSNGSGGGGGGRGADGAAGSAAAALGSLSSGTYVPRNGGNGADGTPGGGGGGGGAGGGGRSGCPFSCGNDTSGGGGGGGGSGCGGGGGGGGGSGGGSFAVLSQASTVRVESSRLTTGNGGNGGVGGGAGSGGSGNAGSGGGGGGGAAGDGAGGGRGGNGGNGGGGAGGAGGPSICVVYVGPVPTLVSTTCVAGSGGAGAAGGSGAPGGPTGISDDLRAAP